MVHPYNRTIPIFENEYAKSEDGANGRLRFFVIIGGACGF